MYISVVVPTYNGAHKLPNIITALKKQLYQPNEILVVVDGSTDNTISVLEDLKLSCPTLRIIFQENKGRAVVRNKGATEAQGDLLIFFDDDMIPAHDCIKEHVNHHKVTPKTILTGAALDVTNKEKGTEIQKFRSALSNKWSAPLIQQKLKPLLKEQIFITAANFSISKQLFLQLGGFDERLRDAEDFDLAVRAFKSGISLYYDHDAFAWHNDEISTISYVRRLRQYREAHDKLKELKPETYNDIQQHALVFPQGLKARVFLFFANRYWIEWLDKSSWKLLLPRSIRYKLYDIIITSNGVYYPEKVPL